MTLQKLVNVGLVSVGLAVALGACSRDHIEAVNLANEGDQAVKVNVEGAIQKYEQAVQLDPTSQRILWKLAVAYEKKEDWDKMASTLSRAVQLAPDFANYWFKRGHALVMQAEGGNPDAFEQAKEPLKKCLEVCLPATGRALHYVQAVQGGRAGHQRRLESGSARPEEQRQPIWVVRTTGSGGPTSR